MEKKRREWVDNGVLHWEPVYSAVEVDAYRAAVKALVEDAKELSDDAAEEWGEKRVCVINARKAIAAVERLEVDCDGYRRS